ncbi:MAG: DUF4160 domain-containing protein [Planctomycetota bacterium]
MLYNTRPFGQKRGRSRFIGTRVFGFIFSGEGRELPHVHVRRGEDNCKFWLQPLNRGTPYLFPPPTRSGATTSARSPPLLICVTHKEGTPHRNWSHRFSNKLSGATRSRLIKREVFVHRRDVHFAVAGGAQGVGQC